MPYMALLQKQALPSWLEVLLLLAVCCPGALTLCIQHPIFALELSTPPLYFATHLKEMIWRFICLVQH